MRRRHQEGPQGEIAEADLHADREFVPIAARQPIDAEGDQADGGDEPKQRGVDRRLGRNEKRNHDRNRGGMPERDRRQRLHHRGAAAALQPQSDGEQPAHRRIDAVEQTEPGEREPGPNVAHG